MLYRIISMRVNFHLRYCCS